MTAMLQFQSIHITAEILKCISELDEFKGKWQATQDLAPDLLGRSAPWLISLTCVV